MANASYTGREGEFSFAGVVQGVCELVEVEVEQGIIPVEAIGSYQASDLKEDGEVVKWRARKAYITADFWNKITRDAQGYLGSFTIVMKLMDKSGGLPGTHDTRTLTSCKASKWGLSVPARGGVVVENIEGFAISIARTTG